MIVNERGLTLAEILVAVAIIGLGLVGLAVVIPVSSYGVQEGNQLSTATFLAEQMIERARAAAWSATPASDCLGVSTGNAAPVPTEVVDNTGTLVTATCVGAASPTVTQFPDETTSGVGVSGYRQYTRIVRVTACSSSSCAGVSAGTSAHMLRKVGVTVTYTPLTASGGQSPSPKTVYLEWLVSQK
jgi:prepilin-type N-terminal cleavage/methylation domain-containing protein